jgi:hypothetical protein
LELSVDLDLDLGVDVNWQSSTARMQCAEDYASNAQQNLREKRVWHKDELSSIRWSQSKSR